MFSPGTRLNVCKVKIKPTLVFTFSCEKAYADDRAANFYVLVEDAERQVLGLERDVGGILQSRCEIGVDILVSTIAAASGYTDIAETSGVSKAIDAYVRNYHQQG